MGGSVAVGTGVSVGRVVGVIVGEDVSVRDVVGSGISDIAGVFAGRQETTEKSKAIISINFFIYTLIVWALCSYSSLNNFPNRLRFLSQ